MMRRESRPLKIQTFLIGFLILSIFVFPGPGFLLGSPAHASNPKWAKGFGVAGADARGVR